jgi:hypothetical protein
MPDAEGEAEAFYPSEFSETAPVSERLDHVDAVLRDAVFTPGIARSALGEGVSRQASHPVSERPDHVDVALRDAGRITGIGRNAVCDPQVALASRRSATDIVLQARGVFLDSWSEIDDILPTLATDWHHRA